MFCDLVDSTTLSGQLDPEEYRDVVRAYQRVCTDVIQRYDGHVAQLLGDGLLVSFGYPHAHEDDAQRAVHAGLGMLAVLEDLNCSDSRTSQRLRTNIAPAQRTFAENSATVLLTLAENGLTFG